MGSGTSAFVAALEEIRVRALSCEYVLPVPDPSEVRVVLGCILPPPR